MKRNGNKPDNLSYEDFELVSEGPTDGVHTPRALLIAYPANERLARTVRGILILMALSFAAVLGTAAWINPYDEQGQAKSMATHTQLGLPPCSAMEMFGKPCPACGMTTSFALFMHADPLAAAKANWVGLLLAMLCFVAVPWGIASAIRGKYYMIGSLEKTCTIIVSLLLVTMLGRWLVIMLTLE